MASYTSKLSLLKKDPSTDGADTFNIETMLNENWDKVDEAVSNLDTSLTEEGMARASADTALQTAINSLQTAINTALALKADLTALTTHTSNTNNIHQVTLTQAAAAGGTLPITSGGTGQTTAAAARNALGLGNTSGALPVANGGTGSATAAAARTALGAAASGANSDITSLSGLTTALPIAQGGTAGVTAAAALYNLIGGAAAITPDVADKVPFLDVSGSTGGYATITDLIAALGLARVAAGSYTGAGTYGSTSKNSLTFSFVPKFIFISAASAGYPFGFLLPSLSYGWCCGDYSNNNVTLSVSISGNTVSWYNANSAISQLNISRVYNYVAIG